MSRLIKISKLAEDLGVTRQCLHSWSKKGLIEFVRSPGGSNYVTQETYDSLLNITKNNLKEDAKEFR